MILTSCSMILVEIHHFWVFVMGIFKSLCVLSFFSSPAMASVRDPVATPWPLEFVINFKTNITTSAESPIPVSGIAYYDWTITSQRIEHEAGAYECTEFYNSTQPCTLFFLPDGLYRIIQEPLPEGQELTCCLDMPGIGPSPPDWASRTHPSYTGVVTDLYSTYEAYEWAFDKLASEYDPHLYREVEAGHEYEGRPLLFTFPAADGRQDYHYDPASMVEGPLEDSIFALPEGCQGTPCTSSV